MFPNSPAEKAGLKKGDYIISVDGVNSSDTETWLRKPRTKVGETHVYVVKRDEQEIKLDLTYSGLPTKEERKFFGLNLLLIDTIIGLAPLIILSLLQIIAPKVVLPGSEFYFIAFILIPISLAVATWKKETVWFLAGITIFCLLNLFYYFFASRRKYG